MFRGGIHHVYKASQIAKPKVNEVGKYTFSMGKQNENGGRMNNCDQHNLPQRGRTKSRQSVPSVCPKEQGVNNSGNDYDDSKCPENVSYVPGHYSS